MNEESQYSLPTPQHQRAALPGAGTPAGHNHIWTPIGVESPDTTAVNPRLAVNVVAYTIVLLRCNYYAHQTDAPPAYVGGGCGAVRTERLEGTWTIDQINGKG